MTTLLAGRSLVQDLAHDLMAFFRSLAVAGGDEASTGFSWPRGL